MFKNLDKDQKTSALEKEIAALWEAERTFERSVEERADGPAFVFYEGPPTANGAPGLHHVMARSVKDAFCRYKTMKGFCVRRKAGWDTHGLPVEIEVQKRLGLSSRADIETYGVEAFNRKCRESVFSYKDMWDRLTREMGYWIDLQDPYVTLEDRYIETGWWILARFHEEGLVYKGHRVVPYCPHCETPLSSHEVAQGYKEVKDPSVTVVFETVDAPFDLLVWTTTPWTLVSNVAVGAGADIDYALVRLEGRPKPVVVARARLEAVTGGEGTVERIIPGRELVGVRYKQLFDCIKPDAPAHRVIAADFVSTEDGTGLVHLAPAFGEDDYRACRKEGLPLINPVDGRGRFDASVPEWAGRFVKDADPDIITAIKRRGLLFRSQKISHSYPHCWRCDSPLLYYARSAWYIRMTALKDKLIEANSRVRWYPETIGTGRFGQWLENLQDWSISRDRYWGTPLPLWVCEDPACARVHAVKSRQELRERSGADVPELHKPYVDAVTFPCPACGKAMRRTPEVMDCWFDSGAMPFAQWHFPFEHAEDFDERFPADFICEGVDQTRGWFYSLLAISVFLRGESPYRNVVVNELVLDKDGAKMSKSRGNAVNPFELLEKYGADVVRWYLLSATSVWLPKRFDEEAVAGVKRKLFDTLANTYRFFALYANVDGFTLQSPRVPVAERPMIDRWLLARMNSVVESYADEMDAYDATRALAMLSDFLVEEVSNWYVRLNRRRFWKGGDSADKRAAYCTLQEVLVVSCRLMAPAAPFLADRIHRELSGEGSVHLALMPEADDDLRDAPLEARMEATRRVVELGRNLRTKEGLKVRQPLPEMLVRSDEPLFEDVVLAELNVKKFTAVDSDGALVRKSAKPRFKLLGPRYGKRAQAVAEAIKRLDAEGIAAAERGEELVLDAGGERTAVPAECVEVSADRLEGVAVATDKGLLVALRTDLSEELVLEGLVREFVNRVQHMRKEAGLEITDRIRLRVAGDGRLLGALATHRESVEYELLASLETTGPVDGAGFEAVRPFELEGLSFAAGMSRVAG